MMHVRFNLIPFLFSILLAPGLFTSCHALQDNPSRMTQIRLEKQLSKLSEKAEAYIPMVPLDSTKIPRALKPDGSLLGSTSKDWTSGFHAGILWQLYRYSKQPALRTAATQWMAFQEKEKMDRRTHDLGFKIYCSYGEAYKTIPDEAYKKIILQASQTLIKRFNPTVGAIRSWDHNSDKWDFPVIIDNMMNLDMLFQATRLSGDSTFHKVAYRHALTTLQNHYREDGSSYHVIDYDTLTGGVRNRHTHQGAAHESAWARGQAWGLYGFSMAYGATKDIRFLEQAKVIAQFFFNHPNLPKDKIPYWDFDAPGIPNVPRDVSAATIAASGLLILYQHDPANQKTYLSWADAILNSLENPTYISNTAPFFLQHSVGNIPSKSEVDVPIIYADYYYVEALLRRLQIEQTRFRS